MTARESSLDKTEFVCVLVGLDSNLLECSFILLASRLAAPYIGIHGVRGELGCQLVCVKTNNAPLEVLILLTHH